jgi:hypothetical protein
MSDETKSSGKKSRRSPRREAALPIRVFGTTPKGRDFTETCVCVKVSQHGGQIRLKHLLLMEAPLVITNLRTNREGSYRVVAQVTNPADKDFADWGVEALDPEKNILA